MFISSCPRAPCKLQPHNSYPTRRIGESLLLSTPCSTTSTPLSATTTAPPTETTKSTTTSHRAARVDQTNLRRPRRRHNHQDLQATPAPRRNHGEPRASASPHHPANQRRSLPSSTSSRSSSSSSSTSVRAPTCTTFSPASWTATRTA